MVWNDRRRNGGIRGLKVEEGNNPVASEYSVLLQCRNEDRVNQLRIGRVRIRVDQICPVDRNDTAAGTLNLEADSEQGPSIHWTWEGLRSDTLDKVNLARNRGIVRRTSICSLLGDVINAINQHTTRRREHIIGIADAHSPQNTRIGRCESFRVVDSHIKTIDLLSNGKNEQNVNAENAIDQLAASSYGGDLDGRNLLTRTLDLVSRPSGETQY